MKAHVIDQSRNESIVMSPYLLPLVNHQLLTGRLIFSFTMTDCDWPVTSLARSVWNVKIANFLVKIHTSICEYLGFHTGYGLETLRIII